MSEKYKKDLRNALAKARDEWMVTPAGVKCLDGSTIYVPAEQWQYLSNRIEAAFVAGWTAKEDSEPKEISHQVVESLDLDREV